MIGPGLLLANAGTKPPFVEARDSQPIVLTGAQLPAWSGPAATGVAAPYPSGAASSGDRARSAHNGFLVVPPATGVSVDQITAFRWLHNQWSEVPVQVDQRFPYFLANGHSGFSTYSGTDEELTYAWAPDAHDRGEESWKKVFGQCSAGYQQSAADLAAAKASGAVTPSAVPGIAPDDYTGAMQDPVPTFDNDDEISFMAGDAGPQAPSGTAPPAGASKGQTVTIADPTTGALGYVYLFLRPGGSSFNYQNGYVRATRDANADEWVDRYSFKETDPLKIGTSNTSYGPNLPGTVCVTADAASAPRTSTDRQPRDGVTIATPTYLVHADGRWLVRTLEVARPNGKSYGPNLIQRWKGRAFQQSPDSSISLVGFEDEQVNWEMNSSLLGWRSGPVRTIREVWGADSGTNVTKTEVYYRDADLFHYRLRVHPIPPDGLYTDWDYNLGAVSTYYNKLHAAGLPIDGSGKYKGVEIDSIAGQNAYFNTCDPTFDVCSALDNPEEVAGPNGGLVSVTELVGATSGVHPAVVPYYRDDACFDDGTGDGPAQRPWPGEASTDPRVQQGYVDYWKAHGAPATLTYADLKCNPTDRNPLDPPWVKTPFAGAIGQLGVHFFFTTDSDNAFTPKTVDEVDAQTWRYEVPMSHAQNVMDAYGQNVVVPLRAVATPYV